MSLWLRKCLNRDFSDWIDWAFELNEVSFITCLNELICPKNKYLVIPSNAEETYAELQWNFERLSDKFLSISFCGCFSADSVPGSFLGVARNDAETGSLEAKKSSANSIQRYFLKFIAVSFSWRINSPPEQHSSGNHRNTGLPCSLNARGLCPARYADGPDT